MSTVTAPRRSELATVASYMPLAAEKAGLFVGTLSITEDAKVLELLIIPLITPSLITGAPIAMPCPSGNPAAMPLLNTSIRSACADISLPAKSANLF